MSFLTSEQAVNLKAQAREEFEYLSNKRKDNLLYELVGLNGGGELVQLTNEAILSKDFTRLDEAIKKKVFRFTLKNERVKSVQESIKSIMDKISRVGFNIYQRGAVGETLLHLCLLNGTYKHNELAKRLLLYFPSMVNDFYLSEEFHGL